MITTSTSTQGILWLILCGFSIFKTGWGSTSTKVHHENVNFALTAKEPGSKNPLRKLTEHADASDSLPCELLRRGRLTSGTNGASPLSPTSLHGCCLAATAARRCC